MKKHLSKRSDKENRMYEHVKRSARGQGERAEEMAARTVNKYHKQRGHRPGE